MKKIGLLGGTFDPPHLGHLIVAEEVKQTLDLTEIWFLPNHIPPHKQDKQISSGKDRLEMLKRALSGNDSFKIETMELNREGPSYTIDTVLELQRLYSKVEFYFIIGADMVEYLPKWYQIDVLIERLKFVGVKRPGYKLQTTYPIIEVEVPEIGISSSFLRDRIKNKLNTKYYLPKSVEKYIEENQIYGKE